MAGYSGKSLWEKLGYRSGMSVLTMKAPPHYKELLGQLPPEVQLCQSAPIPYMAVHIFSDSRPELEKALKALRGKLSQQGMIWVSWPKKSSKIATDISDNVVREIALPLGFVDIKVCAVDEIWSGLKLVIRKDQRQ